MSDSYEDLQYRIIHRQYIIRYFQYIIRYCDCIFYILLVILKITNKYELFFLKYFFYTLILCIFATLKSIL